MQRKIKAVKQIFTYIDELILFFCFLLICFTSQNAISSEISRFKKLDKNLKGLPTGVWESKGYGYIIDTSNDEFVLYHTSESFCFPDPRSNKNADGIFTFWKNGNTKKELIFSSSSRSGETLYSFTKIAQLPTECINQKIWTPRARFDYVIDTFQSLYIPYAVRNLNFNQKKDEILEKYGDISNEKILWDALGEFFISLGDPHSQIESDFGTIDSGAAKTIRTIKQNHSNDLSPKQRVKIWINNYINNILQDVLVGKGEQIGNSRVIWGRNGDVGYVNLLSMGQFSSNSSVDDFIVINKILDKIFKNFRDCKAVIVDVSNNRGGEDSIARQIASRFADKKRLVYSKNVTQTSDQQPQHFYISPIKRPSYSGKVYVITSDITVSAAEIFVMAMKTLPQVTVIGMTTRGALSDTLVKPLDNGWIFTLSAEKYLDQNSTWYEGIGIKPDIETELFDNEIKSDKHSKIILKLIESINLKNEVKS